MTFCLGINCEEGLVAIADTMITSGSEVSMGKKIAVHQGDGHSMFVLTSGLRSVRDKAITYFDERVSLDNGDMTKSYQAVNALAAEIRRVYEEDNDWLNRAGLHFDLHCIVGTQLSEDLAPHLYLVYPQGNWVEVTPGTPYAMIGDTRYGKPVLDRTLQYDATLERSLRVGLLAFNATQFSSTDVGPPVDALVYSRNSFQMRERRFSEEELAPISDFWQESIRRVVDDASSTVQPLFRSLHLDPR